MSVGKRTLAIGLLALAATTSLPAGAQDAAQPKWGPHIDLEGKAGNQRHLGEADLFLPVLQNDRSMLFANMRTRADTNNSYEGNFGLGARHMLEAGWNLGAYGYFDRRRTENAGRFNQVTVGTEALGVKALGQDFDFRANGYIPVGRKVRLVDDLSTAEVSGATVIFKGGEEHSLGGFDAEIGWRVPVTAPDSGLNLRLFGGGYRFWASSSNVPDVQGPRGRVELVFDQVPVLWEGSRFSLGAEGQSDQPRGAQAFLSARLRIPLQVFGKPSSKLTVQERRMADPIVRDIDIVAQAGAYGAPETASASNGGTMTVVDSSSTTGAGLQTALTNAGANSTVLLSGTFNTTSAVALQSGQTVMGSGNVTVRSPSGRTATLAVSNSATISAGLGATGSSVTMANNSTIKGMTISGSDSSGVIGIYGILADGVTGVTIANNTITATDSTSTAIGIRMINSASATVSGNSVTATRTSGGGSAVALQVDTSTATVTGSSFSASGSGTDRAFLLTSANIQSGSTGNTTSAGSCVVQVAGTGTTISYTTNGIAGTCGP